jgi:hypothetical protein
MDLYWIVFAAVALDHCEQDILLPHSALCVTPRPKAEIAGLDGGIASVLAAARPARRFVMRFPVTRLEASQVLFINAEIV